MENEEDFQMRSNEFITELFRNSKTEWKWTKRDKDECYATFIVGKIPYIWNAFMENKDIKRWDIIFTIDYEYANDNGLEYFGITSTGNSAAVMSVVAEITKEFIQTYNKDINQLMFSAEEESRHRLYVRMVKRLLPGWDIRFDDVYIDVIRPTK